MTVITGPGTDLAALTKSLHVLVKCTVDGGGLLKDHIYQSSTDGTQWIDVTGVATHSHSSSSTGGSILDIMRSNARYIDLTLTKTDDRKIAQWVGTATSGGTTADNIDGTTGERSIKLIPGATLGGAYTITYPHLQIDFSKRSMFQTKVRLETASSLALHSGVNVDAVTIADSNTAKYGAEVCTSINNNWQLRSASGSNKTLSDTGVAMTVNRTAIRIEHLPDLGTPEVDMYLDVSGGAIGVQGTVFQKTSDVPITGQSADATLIVHSIKNNIAADRPYHTYADRLCYFVGDHWI